MRFCPLCNTQYSDKIEYCFRDGVLLDLLVDASAHQYESASLSSKVESHSVSDKSFREPEPAQTEWEEEIKALSVEGVLADLGEDLQEAASRGEEEFSVATESTDGGGLLFDDDWTEAETQELEQEDSIVNNESFLGADEEETVVGATEESFEDLPQPAELDKLNVDTIDLTASGSFIPLVEEIPQDGFGLLSMDDLVGFSSDATSPMLRPKSRSITSKRSKPIQRFSENFKEEEQEHDLIEEESSESSTAPYKKNSFEEDEETETMPYSLSLEKKLVAKQEKYLAGEHLSTPEELGEQSPETEELPPPVVLDFDALNPEEFEGDNSALSEESLSIPEGIEFVNQSSFEPEIFNLGTEKSSHDNRALNATGFGEERDTLADILYPLADNPNREEQRQEHTKEQSEAEKSDPGKSPILQGSADVSASINSSTLLDEEDEDFDQDIGGLDFNQMLALEGAQSTANLAQASSEMSSSPVVSTQQSNGKMKGVLLLGVALMIILAVSSLFIGEEPSIEPQEPASSSKSTVKPALEEIPSKAVEQVETDPVLVDSPGELKGDVKEETGKAEPLLEEKQAENQADIKVEKAAAPPKKRTPRKETVEERNARKAREAQKAKEAEEARKERAERKAREAREKEAAQKNRSTKSEQSESKSSKSEEAEVQEGSPWGNEAASPWGQADPKSEEVKKSEVQIVASATAEVFVDGVLRGRGGCKVMLDYGDHRFYIVERGIKSSEKKIKVSSNQMKVNF